MVDTEVLFALNPRDSKHSKVVRLLESSKNFYAPDVGLLEFQLVLRGRGRKALEVKEALLALENALLDCGVNEVKTLDTRLLALQSEIELRYGLSFLTV